MLLEKLKKLERGVRLGDGPTAPAQVVRIRPRGDNTLFSLVLHEGRKRQIRRMCQKVGLPLLHLKRIRQGGLVLGPLPRGHWRELNAEEIEALETRPEKATRKRS